MRATLSLRLQRAVCPSCWCGARPSSVLWHCVPVPQSSAPAFQCYVGWPRGLGPRGRKARWRQVTGLAAAAGGERQRGESLPSLTVSTTFPQPTEKVGVLVAHLPCKAPALDTASLRTSFPRRSRALPRAELLLLHLLLARSPISRSFVLQIARVLAQQGQPWTSWGRSCSSLPSLMP